MRLAIVTAALLTTSACVAKKAPQTAAVPTAAARVGDSVLYRDIRRLVMQLDSLVKDIKTSTPARPSSPELRPVPSTRAVNGR